MKNLILQSIPYLVLLLNILTLILFVSILSRQTWGKEVVEWVHSKALVLGLLISFGAVLGSLFYSVVMHYTPCVLCYWQRIALFPLLVLFKVALWKKDRGVFRYVVPLSVTGLLIAIYHSYIQWGGNPLIPCDAAGTCTKLYVYAFGYITIPTMVISVAIPIILLAWVNHIYENRNA